jgi:hypothetical protein
MCLSPEGRTSLSRACWERPSLLVRRIGTRPVSSGSIAVASTCPVVRHPYAQMRRNCLAMNAESIASTKPSVMWKSRHGLRKNPRPTASTSI